MHKKLTPLSATMKRTALYSRELTRLPRAVELTGASIHFEWDGAASGRSYDIANARRSFYVGAVSLSFSCPLSEGKSEWRERKARRERQGS